MYDIPYSSGVVQSTRYNIANEDTDDDVTQYRRVFNAQGYVDGAPQAVVTSVDNTAGVIGRNQ